MNILKFCILHSIRGKVRGEFHILEGFIGNEMILNRLVHTVSIDSVAGMQPRGTVEREREIECVWFGDAIAFKMDVVYSSSSLKMLSLCSFNLDGLVLTAEGSIQTAGQQDSNQLKLE